LSTDEAGRVGEQHQDTECSALEIDSFSPNRPEVQSHCASPRRRDRRGAVL